MLASTLEDEVGHPGRRWDELLSRVKNDSSLQTFESIEEQWFDLMWCLDQYRTAGVAPARMGNQNASVENRLSGVYRLKGNWFATILTEILKNATGQIIEPRQRVRGFSQTHQIDITWPTREFDPLVCVEAKVSGGPAYGTTPARGALSDWSNRRKELKFAATDLKLSRRKHDTHIDSWREWRRNAPPAIYILWGARLRPGDQFEKLTEQVQQLTGTYLDGGGIVAWQASAIGSGYRAAQLPANSYWLSLDEALRGIRSRINEHAAPGDSPPPPRFLD